MVLYLPELIKCLWKSQHSAEQSNFLTRWRTDPESLMWLPDNSREGAQISKPNSISSGAEALFSGRRKNYEMQSEMWQWCTILTPKWLGIIVCKGAPRHLPSWLWLQLLTMSKTLAINYLFINGEKKCSCWSVKSYTLEAKMALAGNPVNSSCPVRLAGLCVSSWALDLFALTFLKGNLIGLCLLLV